MCTRRRTSGVVARPGEVIGMSMAPPGYRSMSEAEKRAVRRRISEEISTRDTSSTLAVVSPLASSTDRVLAGARADLEAFERGDDALMGMPRRLVDFTAAYAAIDARLYSDGISARPGGSDARTHP